MANGDNPKPKPWDDKTEVNPHIIASATAVSAPAPPPPAPRANVPGDSSGFRIRIQHIASNAAVTFPGFLKEWSDRYTSNWKQEMVFGRMDPIEIFEGTRREISLGWSVVASSKEEAAGNLRRVSSLVNMLYPTYKTHGVTKVDGYRGVNASISSSPLLMLSFTNMVTNVGSDFGLVGRMDGLSVTPELEVGWIAQSKQGGPFYPKVITLSCTYYVLHTHMLGWSANEKNKAFAPSFPYEVGNASGASMAPLDPVPTGVSQTSSDDGTPGSPENSESAASDEMVFEGLGTFNVD